MKDFFVSRSLFAPDRSRSASIVSLETGFIAPPSTNVDKTEEIGQLILDKMYAVENVKTFKLTKRILTIQVPPATATQSLSGKPPTVVRDSDPQLYLQWLLGLLEDMKCPELSLDDTLKQYELVSVAPSLFDENGFLRTASKADLAKAMIP